MKNPKRDQIWQTPYVLQRSQDIAKALIQQGQPTDLLRAALTASETKHEKLNSDWSEQLESFLLIAETLRVCAKSPEVDLLSLEKLHAKALAILSLQGINQKSRLYWLVNDLNLNLSKAYQAHANPRLAEWFKHLGQESVEVQQAERQIQNDNIVEALKLLEPFKNQENSMQARRLTSRCLQLRGEPLAALEYLKSTQNDGIEWEWQKICLQAQLTADLDYMYAWIRKTHILQKSQLACNKWLNILLEAKLWGWATQSRKWANQGFSCSQIRHIYKKQKLYFELDSSLFRAVHLLERCQQFSAHNRFVEMAKVFKLDLHNTRPEYRLLFWSAVIRLLYRTKKNDLMVLAVKQLTEISLALTSGKSKDCLGLVSDIVYSNFPPPINKIKSDWSQRISKYGSLIFDLSRVLGRSRFYKLIYGHPAFNLKSSEIDDLGAVLTTHLAEMKGPVMKLGQFASYTWKHVHPTMTCLQDHSTPVDFDVKKVVQEELNAPLKQHFAKFIDQPIGTGSVGQVYRAVLQSGEEVAVKVQYPGIEQAIGFDLKLLRALSPVIKLIAPQIPFTSLLNEIETRMWEESDYHRELNFYNYFHSIYRNHEQIKIPRVYPDCSTRKILTTEYIRGKKFRDFTTTASQTQKNCAGEAIVRFVVETVCRGTFSSDPHPGNYLFEDNKVVFLDFGSVKQWHPTTLKPWLQLIQAGVKQNFELFCQSVCAMGLVKRSDHFDFTAAFQHLVSQKAGLWTSFGEQQLNQELMQEQFKNLFIDQMKTRNTSIRLPAEYLFGFRVYYGHIAVVAQLGASADWNKLVGTIVDSHV